MPIVKVYKNFHVRIPAVVRKELNISEGDFLEATITEDGILYKMHEKAEVELSPSGKQKLEKALIEIESGKTEEFDSVDDLIKDLTQ